MYHQGSWKFVAMDFVTNLRTDTKTFETPVIECCSRTSSLFTGFVIDATKTLCSRRLYHFNAMVLPRIA